MIKKLRVQFIRIVTVAFLAVLILILAGVNLVNRHNVYATIDARLDFLADSSMGPPVGMVASTPWEIRSWVDLNSAGIMNETSYFIFDGTMVGPILTHQLEMLTAASGEDAASLIEALLAGTQSTGTVGSYRYLVVTRETPYRIVFVNCETEFAAIRSLWRTSLLVGVISFIMVLLLAALLSGTAIRPFAQNIENQRRFISNASHELKTPLGVIVSDLDLQMLESGRSEWLENAQEQADHLAQLIDQLTTYTLLEEKKQNAAEIPIDLSLLSEDILTDYRPQALVKHQTMTADIQPGVTVVGNEDALRTLFSVLMDNAVKYTPDGGAIRLCVRREKKAVIELTNSRDGSDGDLELDQLFERFYRAPEHRAEQDGHGLGLAIAHEIATMYGGSIRAQGGNRTVTFTVEL